MRLKGSTVTSESLLPPLTIHTHPPLVLSTLAPILGVLTATVVTAQPQLLQTGLEAKPSPAGMTSQGCGSPACAQGQPVRTCSMVRGLMAPHGSPYQPSPSLPSAG